MPNGLVFLPGMMCDERLFAPQIKHLSPWIDCAVADLSTADAIEKIASNILDGVKFDVFSLCGLSMGGIVAMELMRQAPERINKVALLNTNHLADAQTNRPIRLAQIEAVKAGNLRDVIIDEMKPNYLATVNQGKAALLNLLIEMAVDLGEEAFINQSKALLDRSDFSDVLAGWKKPTLIISGNEDQLCPTTRHEQINELISNSKLEIVKNSGHISTLEQPEQINSLLESFFCS